MDQNLFATDPDLRKGFLAIANKRRKTELNTNNKRRKMPAKRKRSYSSRRTYKRRRTAPSASATAKALARLTKQIGPFGVANSATMTEYGPSMAQMKDDPSLFRTPAQTQARLRDNYRGPGGYWQDVGRNIGHWGSRIAGAALGGLAGAEGGVAGAITGAVGGWDTGAQFSKARGWGSFEIPRHANDLIVGGDWASAGNGSTPIFHSVDAVDEQGDVIISNRELVKLVKSSATSEGFSFEEFHLNPLDATFHHLKTQAAQYEQFEFLGLMFQYVPMTGEGGSNELGVIGMAASYDPAQVRSFNSMEDLMRFKGAATVKPSAGMIFGIECDPTKRNVKTMFTRDNITRDRSFTDPATFYFASEGVNGSQKTLGQLWVTYSCRLRNIKPSYDPSPDQHHSLHSMRHEHPDPTDNTEVLALANNLGQTTGGLHVGDAIAERMKGHVLSVTYEGKSDSNHERFKVRFDRSKIELGNVYKVDCMMYLEKGSAAATSGEWDGFAKFDSSCLVAGADLSGVSRQSDFIDNITHHYQCGTIAPATPYSNLGQAVVVYATVYVVVTNVAADEVSVQLNIRPNGNLQASGTNKYTGAAGGIRIHTTLISKDINDIVI